MIFFLILLLIYFILYSPSLCYHKIFFLKCFVGYLSLSMAKSGAGGSLKRNLETCIFRFLRFMFQCWTDKKSSDNDCKNRRTFTSPYYIYQQ